MSATTEMPPSLWAATAIPAPATNLLSGVEQADVCVVGAGYTGLSAALHLSGADKSVVVIDAAEPGFGCSGRNGGQVNPGSTRMLPNEVIDTLGPEWGERFLQFGDRSCDLVFELIDRYRIDCQAQRPGYIQGAYGQRGAKINQQWLKQWEARGVSVKELNTDQTAELIGARGYQAGLLDPRGGSVQPLSYARGLAHAAIAQGVRLYGNSAALAVQKNGAGWTVKTAQGSVQANQVILATNGYTDKLWPGLRESVVPVASFITATEPMSPDLRAQIVPGGHAVSETARVIVYYRVDPQGRFVIGGHGNLFNAQQHGDFTHIRQQAERLFPQLQGIGWEYEWAGWPAMTKNHTPHLFKLADGAYAGLGYNGRGVASATLMGQQLAHVVSGQDEPLIRCRPLDGFKLHPARQIGVSWHLLSGKAFDAVNRRL